MRMTTTGQENATMSQPTYDTITPLALAYAKRHDIKSVARLVFEPLGVIYLAAKHAAKTSPAAARLVKLIEQAIAAQAQA